MIDRTLSPEDHSCDTCGSSPAYDVYGDWVCHDCWQQASDVIEAASKDIIQDENEETNG